MPVHSKARPREARPRTYPVLGWWPETGVVLLFTGPTSGTVVHVPGDHPAYSIGEHREGWRGDWVPYNGDVMLSMEDL